MIKLLLCLLAFVATAVCLVQLRQQRLELNHQCNQLHNAIEARQSRLWNQQLQIAAATTPDKIARQIDSEHLRLEPLAPRGEPGNSWLDSVASTDR
jgi:cell division protein FtsL